MKEQVSREKLEQMFEQMVREAAYFNHLNRIRSFDGLGASYQYRHGLYDWQEAVGQLWQSLGRAPTDKEAVPVAEEIHRRRIQREMVEDWLKAEQELSLRFGLSA